MEFERRVKRAFSVIGLEGSTKDGEGFVARLWAEANARFAEVEPLAARDEAGGLLGIWGAMSDFARTFAPWENFERGLYLAGVECRPDAEPPRGWTRWDIPGFEFLACRADGPEAFARAAAWLRENKIPLAGAAQDFTCPATGEGWFYFPVKRL